MNSRVKAATTPCNVFLLHDDNLKQKQTKKLNKQKTISFEKVLNPFNGKTTNK